jgi:hypothetical protein
MLYVDNPSNAMREASVSGRELAYSLRRRSPVQRALAAHDLESGRIVVHSLTRRQAAKLARSSTGYIATIDRIGEADRERLKHGTLSVSQLHNKCGRDVSDDEIDRFVARAGAGRIFAALDRYTQPPDRLRGRITNWGVAREAASLQAAKEVGAMTSPKELRAKWLRERVRALLAATQLGLFDDRSEAAAAALKELREISKPLKRQHPPKPFDDDIPF